MLHRKFEWIVEFVILDWFEKSLVDSQNVKKFTCEIGVFAREIRTYQTCKKMESEAESKRKRVIIE